MKRLIPIVALALAGCASVQTLPGCQSADRAASPPPSGMTLDEWRLLEQQYQAMKDAGEDLP